MGRKKRTWIPTHFYHISCRGNRREAIFRDPGDYLTYLYILRKVNENFPFELLSYCFMTNHLHLQLRSKEQSISKIMSLVNKRYATYFNNKYRLTGHVFEKRFYDKIINSKQGLLNVSCYIHLNPVEAKMVTKPEDYPWSSYQYYQVTRQDTPPYLNTHLLLEYFSGTPTDQRQHYCQYHRSERTVLALLRPEV